MVIGYNTCFIRSIVSRYFTAKFLSITSCARASSKAINCHACTNNASKHFAVNTETIFRKAGTIRENSNDRSAVKAECVAFIVITNSCEVEESNSLYKTSNCMNVTRFNFSCPRSSSNLVCIHSFVNLSVIRIINSQRIDNITSLNNVEFIICSFLHKLAPLLSQVRNKRTA